MRETPRSQDCHAVQEELAHRMAAATDSVTVPCARGSGGSTIGSASATAAGSCSSVDAGSGFQRRSALTVPASDLLDFAGIIEIARLMESPYRRLPKTRIEPAKRARWSTPSGRLPSGVALMSEAGGGTTLSCPPGDGLNG